MREKISDAAAICGLAFILGGLVIFPAELTNTAKSGVELCFSVLLPALFPFFVVSELTVRLGAAEKLGRLLSPLMRPLFNVSGEGAAALVLGFVGGYPVGARTVISLYDSGRLSRAEAERMLGYANNSGPAFILGVVGAGVLGDSAAGLRLLLVHALSSLLIGVLFRFLGKSETAGKVAENAKFTREAPIPAFLSSVTRSFSQCLQVFGFVLFFAVFIRLLFLSGAAAAVCGLLTRLGFSEAAAESLLSGFIELTSGVKSLGAIEAPGRMALAAFMLGWAGLSVHCQALGFIRESGLSARTYFLGKILHGVLSAALIRLANLVPGW